MLYEAKANHGWIAFQLSVRAADGSVTQSGFSRRWSGNAWTTTDNAIDAPSNALVSQFVKSRNGTLLNASPANPARKLGTGTCREVVLNSYLESTRIINFHNDDNANATWSYGTTADSDIDMGYAAYNSSTWYVSGSYHVTNSKGGTANSSSIHFYNGYARTAFLYTHTEFESYPDDPSPTGSFCNNYLGYHYVGDDHTQATTWAAGTYSETGSGSGYKDCFSGTRASSRVSFPAGSGFSVSTSTATKISWAVGLGYVNLGGTSGYSTNVNEGWQAKRGSGIYLCGANDLITGKPGVIYAEDR